MPLDIFRILILFNIEIAFSGIICFIDILIFSILICSVLAFVLFMILFVLHFETLLIIFIFTLHATEERSMLPQSLDQCNRSLRAFAVFWVSIIARLFRTIAAIESKVRSVSHRSIRIMSIESHVGASLRTI